MKFNTTRRVRYKATVYRGLGGAVGSCKILRYLIHIKGVMAERLRRVPRKHISSEAQVQILLTSIYSF